MKSRYLPMMFDGFMEPTESLFERLNRLPGGLGVFSDGLSARSDMYRRDGKIYVEAELPGIRPDDVELHVYADRLTLSAEKKPAEEAKDRSYFSTERVWGKIERVLSFPVEAEPDSAKAAFRDGVLCIEIEEKRQDKAHKKVDITADA